MRNYLSLCVLVLSIQYNIISAQKPLKPRLKDKNSFKIAFGSCSHQDKNQNILYKVIEQKPDLFIYLGDNIYGDTRNMGLLKAKYNTLGNKPEFKALRNTTRILATWDDHDYGENDAGRHYPFKEISKKIFLDFWEEPKKSKRRKHEGIYTSYMFGKGNKKVQIILLDTRTFRDNLIPNQGNKGYKNHYIPHTSNDSTILGKDQWHWLKTQLKKPAQIRIIASSIQFGHEYNGYESWTNFPHERERMLNLIKDSKAEGVLFISGDVHWAEISKVILDGLYPIFDVTSSGLNQKWYKTENNKNRIGGKLRANNFGLIEVNWNEETTISLKVLNKKGKIRLSHNVLLKKLRF